MKKWSVRKAAAAGMLVGLISLLLDLHPQYLSSKPMFALFHALNTLAWILIFGGVAWLRNRFIGRSRVENPE